MQDEPTGSAQRISRRSLLGSALGVGGGVALSAAMPSLVQATPKLPSLALAQLSGAAASGTGAEARFSPEFLTNKAFSNLALNFDPPTAIGLDGQPLQAGAVAQSNGEMLFRIYAPKASIVSLRLDRDHTLEHPLAKQADGTFQGVIGYDDNRTGPCGVEVTVDGAAILDPYLPIHWSRNRPFNFVDFPDTELDFMLVKDVPHGMMVRDMYWAANLKSWERCIVYTPPGYMNSTQHYPVLYLQHGGTDNETSWEDTGKAAYILDNLIAEGRATPFLAVMNNDMLRYATTSAGVIDDAFERMLIDSCIPHIEGNYRVTRGKWNRAIGGLSMGSYMSCDIGFRNPGVFGSLGTFTASMTHETFKTTYERPYRAFMGDPDKVAHTYKVYYRSTTPNEDHFNYFEADDEICARSGIDKLPGYHRIVYPKRVSKWNSWRMGLRDYASLLFK